MSSQELSRLFTLTNSSDEGLTAWCEHERAVSGACSKPEAFRIKGIHMRGLVDLLGGAFQTSQRLQTWTSQKACVALMGKSFNPSTRRLQA